MALPQHNRETLLMKLFFMLQPIAFGSWLPRIPEIQQSLHLDAQGLAFALAGLPTGVLLTLPFAGKAVHAAGPRTLLLEVFPIFLICTTLPVWAPSQFGLFLALVLLGCTMSTTELAMNVEADRLEKHHHVSIMNACHGFWSLGMMLGSLIGAGLAQMIVPPGWSVTLTAILLIVPSWLIAYALPRVQPAVELQASPTRANWWPCPALLSIALFVFGVTLTEGAIADWSAVVLHDVHGATGFPAGFGYSAFAGLMTLMRLNADTLKQRFTAKRLAQASSVIALVGTVLVATSINTTIATIGFALLGIGAAAAFPLAVSAGGQLTDRPVAASVAFITFVALTGFLIGPVVIGTVAHTFGMRTGLSMLLPALVLSLVLAHSLSGPRLTKNASPQ